MRDIHHVHQYIGLPHLVQSALEGLDKLSGELTYKTHSVAQQERHIFQNHLAHGCVQGGEQFVLCKHVAFCKQVHEGAFAHICIADQRYSNQLPSVAPLRCHLPVYLFELVFQAGYAFQNNTAVGFKLALTRAAHVDTSPLPFQMGPHTCKTRQQILILSQFYLSLGVGGAGPLRKNIQNQSGAVYHTAAGLFLYVAHLGRTQLIVKNDVVDTVLLYIFLNLCQFAAPKVSPGIWMVQPLGKALFHLNVGRGGKEHKFVQILLALPNLILVAYDRCRNGCFDGFFHSVSRKKVAGFAGHLLYYYFDKRYLSWKITGKV